MKTIYQNPQYLDWLHQLTVLGYDEGIIVEAQHSDVIEFYFKEGKTIESALSEYKDFKRRWNAIKKDASIKK